MDSPRSLPKTAAAQADDAFIKSLSPEIIAQQERIMKQIEDDKQRGGRRADSSNLRRRELPINSATFC